MAKRAEVPRPSDEMMWSLIDQLIATFERTGEIAPVLRTRFNERHRERSADDSLRYLIEPQESLISATNDLIDDLMRLGAEVRRVVARRLYADGMSMSEISDAFGVSRQRVSAIISSDTDPTKGPWRSRRSFEG